MRFAMKGANIKDILQAAAIDAHAFAMLYLRDGTHAKEWLECEVDICVARRVFIEKIPEKAVLVTTDALARRLHVDTDCTFMGPHERWHKETATTILRNMSREKII